MTWWRDHVAAGLIQWGIITVLVAVSHMHLLRRIRKLTADQTKALKGGTEEKEAAGNERQADR